MPIDLTHISTVWVDLDDTLIDFTTNARTALTKMWHDEPQLQHYFPTPDIWAERYEDHNMALWARYNVGQITRDYLRLQRFLMPLTEAGMPSAEAEPLARQYDTLYLDYLAREKALMPGAMDLLEYLRSRGVRIGCLSNGFKEVQFRKIRNAGLEPWIDIVVLSDDIGINKPDRRIFDYAMQRTADTDPSHHLMIGDNPQTDIAGALASGWPAIWYHPRRAFPGIPCPAGALEVTDLREIISENN